MKKVRVTEVDGTKGYMYFIEDEKYMDRFSYGRESWLYGEYKYIEQGVIFADKSDAMLYRFLMSEVGQLLAHRLEVMERFKV